MSSLSSVLGQVLHSLESMVKSVKAQYLLVVWLSAFRYKLTSVTLTSRLN